MNSGEDRYIEHVINYEKTGSSLVRVIDQMLPAAPIPDVQTVQVAGGNDGLDWLDDNDFVDSEAGKTGLHAFDEVQDLTLVRRAGTVAQQPLATGPIVRGDAHPSIEGEAAVVVPAGHLPRTRRVEPTATGKPAQHAPPNLG